MSRRPNDTPSEELMATALYSVVRHSIKAQINGEFFDLLKLLTELLHPHPNQLSSAKYFIRSILNSSLDLASNLIPSPRTRRLGAITEGIMQCITNQLL
jgi:hypothetical protein